MTSASRDGEGGHDAVPAASLPLRLLVAALACAHLALSVAPSLARHPQRLPDLLRRRPRGPGRARHGPHLRADLLGARVRAHRAADRRHLPAVPARERPRRAARRLAAAGRGQARRGRRSWRWRSRPRCSSSRACCPARRPGCWRSALLVQTASIRNAIAFGQPYPLLLLLLCGGAARLDARTRPGRGPPDRAGRRGQAVRRAVRARRDARASAGRPAGSGRRHRRADGALAGGARPAGPRDVPTRDARPEPRGPRARSVPPGVGQPAEPGAPALPARARLQPAAGARCAAARRRLRTRRRRRHRGLRGRGGRAALPPRA